MPRPNTLTLAIRDLRDAIAFHTVTLAHGAFDLACVIAFGAFVAASALQPTPTPQTRPMADQQATTVKGCTPAPDCITVAPLDV